MARRRLKVGDCFLIPLPDGRYAYCQYIEMNDELGTLIRVFDRIDRVPLRSTDALATLPNMFPPVFVGLMYTLRMGRWKFLGNLPVRAFEFPNFRASNAFEPGVHHDWRIWDGHTTRFIGSLPPDLRVLEKKMVWGDELLEERISTGRNVFGDADF